MWAQIVSAVAGGLVMASPGLLGLRGASRTEAYIVGPLIITFALIAIPDVTRQVRWVNLPLGLWVLLAPWIVGFHGPARPLDVVLGALVLACALIGGTYRPERYGGGWASLWMPTGDDQGRMPNARGRTKDE